MIQARSLSTSLATGADRWIMFLVLLGFFTFWLQGLGIFSLSSDESATAIMADMSDGGVHRQNQDSPHGPVYNLVMRAWRVAGGGQHEFLVRYPSLLIGLLLLSLIDRAARDLGLDTLGTFAAVLLAGLNPQITLHLREARPYAPMLASVALAAVIALRFERLRAAPWVAAAASLLALLAHYFNIPFIGALGLWGALTLKDRARRSWIISQGIAWAFFAVWLPLMGRAFLNPQSLSTGKTWSFLLPPWETLSWLAMVGAQGYRDYVNTWLAATAALLLVGGWLVGSLYNRRRQRWFLLLMGALPVTLYALLAWVRPVFHPKYVIPWLLFMSLALGQFVSRRHWLGGILCAALLTLMAAPTLRTVQQPYDPGVSSTADLSTVPLELGRELLGLAGPHDVFGAGTPDPMHCYYLQHRFDRSLDCVLLPQYPTQTTTELTDRVNNLLAQHDVLWYLDYYNSAWDPQHTADQVFNQSTLGLGEEEIAGRKLRLYASSATVVRQQQTVGARFDDVAELDGIWLVRAHALHTVLVWHSSADRPAVDAKVFVHLVDQNGEMVSQQDGIPVNWSRPFETWRLGEQLLDVYVLPLPPGADINAISFRIGLYALSTSQRLPAYSAEGQRLPDDAASVPLTR